LIRRIEDGEEITITVAGRVAARLVPAAPHTWRRWTEIAELFTGHFQGLEGLVEVVAV